MKNKLLDILTPFGQEHLLAHWDTLDRAARERLADQIVRIDWRQLARQISQIHQEKQSAGRLDALVDAAVAPPAFRLDAKNNPAVPGRAAACTPDAARRTGWQRLADGRVGAILVAGGQGTRLGRREPKGLLPFGPISGRTLFQMHVEQLRAVARRAGTSIPLYLMTSPATHEMTVEFLDRHDRFGLAKDDLFIFCQGVMPAVDAATGRVLLADRGSLSLAPDGHGGMLAALDQSGSLDHATDRGIEQFYYFQVDNPMVQICEAELIGYHLLSGSEMSTHVVARDRPDAKLGNVVSVDGRLQIIEYSDLPEPMAHRRNEDGALTFWAGSIAVHVFDAALLRRTAPDAAALPFHRAEKAVPYVDGHGQPVEPDEPNAVKFERFIFDLLPRADNAIVVEVDPARRFAPIKNDSGAATDSPVTAAKALVRKHASWLREAGATVADGTVVEINPLFALDASELKDRIAPGLRVDRPTCFGAQGIEPADE